MDSETKIELEYIINSPANEIYEKIATAEGLGTWFADQAIAMDSEINLIWNKRNHYIKMISSKKNRFVKYKWKHKPAHFYFEMRIEESEFTGDTGLLITDFVLKGREESAIEIWNELAKRLLNSFR